MGDNNDRWWGLWINPQTVMVGLSVAAIVYASGSRTGGVEMKVDQLAAQVAEMRGAMATKDSVNRDLSYQQSTYASKESVAVLSTQFTAYQTLISDKLNTFGVQLENVEKLVRALPSRR